MRPVTILRLVSTLLSLVTGLVYVLYEWKVGPVYDALAIGLGSSLGGVHDVLSVGTGALLVLWLALAALSVIAGAARSLQQHTLMLATLLALTSLAATVSLVAMLLVAAEIGIEGFGEATRRSPSHRRPIGRASVTTGDRGRNVSGPRRSEGRAFFRLTNH